MSVAVMEKEEIKWEQEQPDQVEEDDVATLLIRKSGIIKIESANGHVVANGDSIPEEDVVTKPEEKDSEATEEEEEQKEGNLVFYDKVEGTWKCRICTWTYQNGSTWVDHIQNHTEQMHTLMHFKALNFDLEGVESADEEKQILKDSDENRFDISSLDSVVQNGSTSAFKSILKEDLENGGVNSSNLEPSHTSFEDQNNNYESFKEIEIVKADLIDTDDLEVTDLDVEGVLKKQTTHDLFCPNCKSCITKRVILRKRKRRHHYYDDDNDTKEGKIEATGAYKVGTSSLQSPSDPVHPTNGVTEPPRTDEEEIGRGRDIFRCLSCFSFFIPIGNRVKLLFRGKKSPEDVQNEKPSDQQETEVVDQGSSSQTGLQRFSSEGIMETPGDCEDEILPLSNGDTTETDVKLTSTSTETVGQFDSHTEDPIKESKVGQEFLIVPENGLSVTAFPMRNPNANGESSEGGGLKLLVSPNRGSQANEGPISNPTKHSGPADMNGKPNASPIITHEEQDDKTTIPTKSVLDGQNATGSENGIYPIPLGNDAVITIYEPNKPSEIVQGTSYPPDTESLLQPLIAPTERTEERNEFKIELVKSIVYGGLAESVTSLSVVASAAGGGAATLNVLAMGMANLVGGFFIICHNLWELKNERVEEQVENQVSERDRYKELLGRKQNFVVHAILVIISYLIFGLVPPVAYGLSFRETDDRQLKIMLMGAVSFVCIVALAIGKAYTQRPPKAYVTTVITFVMLGFMVSGVSYAAGELVERMLEKFGVFQSGGEALS